MPIFQMAALAWIGGWTLTAWVFIRARKAYLKADRRHRDAEVEGIIDLFSIDPVKSLLLSLVFWPVCLVSFTAMWILPWAERLMEKAEDEEKG